MQSRGEDRAQSWHIQTATESSENAQEVLVVLEVGPTQMATEMGVVVLVVVVVVMASPTPTLPVTTDEAMVQGGDARWNG